MTSLVDAWSSLGLLLPVVLGRRLLWTTQCWVLSLALILPGILGRGEGWGWG